jgi:hypothetical protein
LPFFVIDVLFAASILSGGLLVRRTERRSMAAGAARLAV